MTLSGYIYHCAANESFDSVAQYVYGDEKYSADIMNANPEYCGITTFRGGEKIYIPELPGTENMEEAQLANTHAPWKD